MPHLSLETIARLVDDPPVAAEAAHLDSCAQCRDELDAMRADVAALATLPDLAPAPDAWDSIEQRLAAEGLIRTRRRTGFAFAPAWQAAAAMLLFVAGSAAGRWTASPETILVPAPQAAAPVALGTTSPDPTVAAAGDTGDDVATGEPAARPPLHSPDVRLASADAPRPRAARSVDEAAQLLRQTEEQYLNALTRYAELAMQADAGDPIARLAALTSIVLTTQAALSQAPTDPVINGYHLTALAQRDAALRQVAAATGDVWY